MSLHYHHKNHEELSVSTNIAYAGQVKEESPAGDSYMEVNTWTDEGKMQNERGPSSTDQAVKHMYSETPLYVNTQR